MVTGRVSILAVVLGAVVALTGHAYAAPSFPSLDPVPKAHCVTPEGAREAAERQTEIDNLSIASSRYWADGRTGLMTFTMTTGEALHFWFRDGCAERVTTTQHPTY